MDTRMTEIETKVTEFSGRAQNDPRLYIYPRYMDKNYIFGKDASNNFGLRVYSQLTSKHQLYCGDLVHLSEIVPDYRNYLIDQYMHEDGFDIRNNPEDEYLAMYTKILNRQFNKVRVEPRIKKWYHKFTPEILREIIKNNSKVYIKRKEEA